MGIKQTSLDFLSKLKKNNSKDWFEQYRDLYEHYNTNNTTIKLLSIINWTDINSTYISTINTQYKSEFNSYAKLFDIKTFLVLKKDKASELFTWIR